MRIPSIKRQRTLGNVLMVSLIVTAIIGSAVVSYLVLVQYQNYSVVRSQAWNAAIAIAEAGVEEAMAQLNPGVTGTAPNLAANSWTLNGGNYYAPDRSLGDSSYKVIIVPGTIPVIYSTGYTRVSYSAVPISRTVRVTATNGMMFTSAMAAQQTIDMKGNNLSIDSYDSTDPLYSTNGKYDSKKARDKGDVATNNGLTNSLNVGNANIKGKIRTGAYGLPSVGSQGSVGSSAWVDGGNTGIQPGWFADDFNMEFPDVLPPFSGGAATPVGKTVGGTNYSYVLGTDNYQLSSLSLKTGNAVLVAGRAVLYVTGNVSMSGSSQIYIAPGASLELFVGGASTSLTQVNTSGYAKDFTYYGLPTNTSISWSGNNEFIGTVYAPSASFSLTGGGSNNNDYQGACIVNSVTMNGHFSFHFDESLARNGPLLGYVATSWTEL